MDLACGILTSFRSRNWPILRMSSRSQRVIELLQQGKNLERAGVPIANGRFDVRGISLGRPQSGARRQFGNWAFDELLELVEFTGVSITNVDFSNGSLPGLRFKNCFISNCVFASANLREWRLWGTRIADSSFVKCDLRDSALGGDDEAPNTWSHCDFSEADMRATTHSAAWMSHCSFVNTRLDKVDFWGTQFEYCQFSGSLRNVVFAASMDGDKVKRVNHMLHVDFSNASLHDVWFRNLDLDTVVWPLGSDHIVVSDYPRALSRVIGRLERRADMTSRQLAAMVGVWLKSVGKNQSRGVVSMLDLRECGGSEAVDLFKRCLEE